MKEPITLGLLRDTAAIRDLCERSGEWEAMRADDEPSIGEVPWNILCDDPKHSAWLGVWKGRHLVGAFLFINVGGDIAEVHTLMTRECRGRDAVQAGKMALVVAFSKPLFGGRPLQSIISNCPATNHAASHYAAAVGFGFQTRYPLAWVKHGERHDLLQWGLNKHQFEEQLCRS